MKQRMRKFLCVLTAAAVMSGGIGAAQVPVWGKTEESLQKAGVGRAARAAATVTTQGEFMQALRDKKSPITVQGIITIGRDEDTDKRMLPVKIPAGTEILGTAGSSINSRAPIQLEGNGVSFKDIELTFSSSNGLGSVPHREIFLAGYSLTLDNVKTYLPGGGIMDSTEPELLPTVYGGGYSNTAVGSNASLTVINSNDKTIFQAIYMGHEAENDNKVPYKGNAVLNLDAKAAVRDRVDTSYNSKAEIRINGGELQSVQAKTFFGNKNTTLTITATQLINAAMNDIENIVLKETAYLALKATDEYGGPLQNIMLHNVTLDNGSCLEFSAAGTSVVPATITGNFTGAGSSAADRAILVLAQKNGDVGTLTIDGKVMGTTQLNINYRGMSDMPKASKAYIYTTGGNTAQPNFILSERAVQNRFGLHYTNGAWTVYQGTPPTEGTTSPTTDSTQETTTSPTNPTTAPTQGTTTSPTNPTTAPTQGTTASPEKPTTAPTGSTTKPTTPTSETPVIPPTGPTVTPPTQNPENHKHQYQSSVTKQATCIEAGTRTYTCICGQTYTEDIAPSGHQYAEERIPATSKADGKVQKVCRVCSHITDVFVISRPRNPSWRKVEFTYDGKVKSPEVFIKDVRGSELVPGADYKVRYPQAMKNPGIYTAVIEFCGDYSGRATKTITIKPKAASLKKITSGSRKLLLKWSRHTVQIDGYQVQYSRDKAFQGKTSKTLTVKKTAAGVIVKKLKGKTKYYVRIRTYKNVKVEGNSKKLYSDWSGTKAVYTKK